MALRIFGVNDSTGSVYIMCDDCVSSFPSVDGVDYTAWEIVRIIEDSCLSCFRIEVVVRSHFMRMGIRNRYYCDVPRTLESRNCFDQACLDIFDIRIVSGFRLVVSA